MFNCDIKKCMSCINYVSSEEKAFYNDNFTTYDCSICIKNNKYKPKNEVLKCTDYQRY